MFNNGNGSVDIIPGVLALDEVRADFEIQSGGDFAVALSGQTTLDVAGSDIIIRVKGEVTQDEMNLTGIIQAGEPLDPLALIGLPNVMPIEPNGVVRISVKRDRTFIFELITVSDLSIPALGLNVTPVVALRAKLGGAGAPVYSIVGLIDSLKIEALGDVIDVGQFGNIIVAASTGPIRDYEIDADEDPNTPNKVIDISKGLTLIAGAELTPLTQLFEPGSDLGEELTINVPNLQTIVINAKVNAAFDIIKPSYNIPSLKSLSSDAIGVEFLLTPTKQEVKLFGSMRAVTTTASGQESHLRGEASFTYDQAQILGGEVKLEGDWKEPFRLPKVAILNPGIGVKVSIALASTVGVRFRSVSR